MDERIKSRLERFLDLAAGEGYVLGGIDAADLYIELFPEKYKDALLMGDENE